jgi:Domain of unknown function (DUF5666)
MAVKKENNTDERVTQTTPKTVWSHGTILFVVAVIVAGLIFAGGMAAARHSSSDRVFNLNAGSGFTGMRGGGFGRTGNGGIMMSGNSQSNLRGVVTAVNGSDFTVAGNGATTQISTSSSTQYADGNQVKLNDSVVVSGTTSNGTLQASQIVINP